MGWVVVLVAMLMGCVATGPRFTPDVQESYREHDMRRMETEHLKIYYPEGRNDEARQVATRLEGCLDDIHELTPRPTDWGLVPVFLPEVEFNNAYVAFGAGQDPHIVVPTFFTANLFGQFGFTPSPSAVGCHEMIHYVQFIQIHGVYRAINEAFGPSINPQIGLDLWFVEGLATYYESQLVDGVGRHGSPIWENTFAAGISETYFDGGRLSEWDRAVPNGAHYLVGSYFVAYLADTYGEEKLWELVDLQGSSLSIAFGISFRFWRVYGRTLGELMNEFEAHIRQQYEKRQRPSEQVRQQWVGRSGALEVGPGGRWALFSSDLDSIPTIEVFDDDGDVLLRRQIPDVLPGRDLVGARGVESMRFSPEGESLYFLVNHRGSNQQRTSLMRLDIGSNRLEMVADELRANGGDISPDGQSFVFASADGSRTQFRRLSLDGTSDQDLFRLPLGAYIAWIRISPDGTRIAATLMEDDEWSVAVLDLEDGELIGKWSTGQSHRPAFDPYWLDDDTLLFVAADEDHVQVFEGQLSTGDVLQHTQVPFMAFNPRPDGQGGIQFLNREGWGWALDHISASNGAESDNVVYELAGGDGDDESTGAQIAGYDLDAPQVPVFDDEPYSPFDGLFIPRARAPTIWMGSVGETIGTLEIGVGLSGYDELGFHNWMINARWDFVEDRPSGSFAYVNAQLAPWFITVQAANEWLTTLESEDLVGTSSQARRDRFARVNLRRAFYGNPVWLNMMGAEYLRPETESDEEQRRRFVGPEVGAAYQAGRATSYGGAQWLLGISGQAAGYPDQLGSDFSMADLRSQVQAHTPLPFSDRHRLRLSGRVRSLPGVPDDQALMRVGGFNNYAPFFVSGSPQSEDLSLDLLPPGFLFVEPLRGYEDFGLSANHAAIADINYRFPFIVDRGAASFMTVFPSVFLRGFNLELFASGATLLDEDLHGAVGTSLDMSFLIWRIPISIRYQFAQRLFDDQAQVHTVGLGVGQ